MKIDQLSELYEKLLVAEAAKSDLTDAKNDVVGNLKKEDELFGETPELVDAPKKAKIKEGPSYKISTSSETAPQATSSTHIFKGTKPAESEEGEDADEVKGTRVTPKTENSETEESEKSHEDSDLTQENKPKKDKYNYKQQESFTMNAFENLFKKTLMEQELEDQAPIAAPETDDTLEDTVDSEAPESTESEDLGEDEGDLISDLRELQDKLSAILSKLEGTAEEGEEETEDEGEYSDEDFETEFGGEEGEEEEGLKKESVDKPKILGDKKKKLLGKDNKVGNVRPKGGKAHLGNFKNDPRPKAFSATVKGKGEVKSSVSKGDFIK